MNPVNFTGLKIADKQTYNALCRHAQSNKDTSATILGFLGAVDAFSGNDEFILSSRSTENHDIFELRRIVKDAYKPIGISFISGPGVDPEETTEEFRQMADKYALRLHMGDWTPSQKYGPIDFSQDILKYFRAKFDENIESARDCENIGAILDKYV